MADTKEAELKPGERHPAGADGPKVRYATGKIAELLLGLHPEDRGHVVEQLNKGDLLSKGKSKVEKDQEADAKKRQEESDKWVKESRFPDKEAQAQAAKKAAEEKHQAELDKAKGKPK